jgi:hypothetical protein
MTHRKTNNLKGEINRMWINKHPERGEINKHPERGEVNKQLSKG